MEQFFILSAKFDCPVWTTNFHVQLMRRIGKLLQSKCYQRILRKLDDWKTWSLLPVSLNIQTTLDRLFFLSLRDDGGIWKDPHKVGLIIALSSDKNCFTVPDARPVSGNYMVSFVSCFVAWKTCSRGWEQDWIIFIMTVFYQAVLWSKCCYSSQKGMDYTTLPCLRFSTLDQCFPKPSFCELLRISYFKIISKKLN